MAAITDRRGDGFPWRIVGWGGAAALLLAPLVAMRFTDEVRWDAFDFMFAGALLGGVGLGLELAARKGDAAYRMAAGLALAAAFLAVWINGAVGIIGNERENANLLFVGVPLVALSGAVFARFRAAGMARAMTGAAVAQVLVPAAAFVFGLAPAAALLSAEVLAATGGFAAMWLGSARLFRRAAH